MNLHTWLFLGGLLVVAGCRPAEKPEIAELLREDTLVMEDGGQLARRPEAPLRITGACPFECCTYGAWTTTAETTVYEQPAASAVQFTVPAGTPLEAVSGHVLLTRIGLAIARDTVEMYGQTGAPHLAMPGDTLLILDNVGEGFRRAWHAGGIYQTQVASGEVLREPEEEWWANVRTADGRSGWLWMDHTPPVSGADACGG